MSWAERIKTGFRVTTGDGVPYLPEYFFASVSKNIEFNFAEFVFVNVSGSLVKRGQVRGGRYDIEIQFVGNACLDTRDAFDMSSRNPGNWTIEHPFYKQLLVQPIKIHYDNSNLNVSKINISCIETIDAIAFNPPDAQNIIADKKGTADKALTNAYVASNATLSVTTLSKMSIAAKNVFDTVKAFTVDNQDLSDLTNSYNQLNGFILTATSTPLLIIAQAQTLLNLPATFTNPVVERIAMLKKQFDILAGMLNGTELTPQQKRTYENHAGVTVGALCLASVTNYDYGNRGDVLAVLNVITSTYAAYVGNLDNQQTANGGQTNSYIPDAGSLIGLNDAVNYTIASLYAIAVQAKQERAIILDKDINPIKLAYKLYGLMPDDSTIDLLFKSNNIGLNETLCLKKGRQIIYYV